jgi:hypothetical protein
MTYFCNTLNFPVLHEARNENSYGTGSSNVTFCSGRIFSFQMPEYRQVSSVGNLLFVRSEGFTEVTMKNAVFWDVAPCRSCEFIRSTWRHIPEDPILQFVT